MAAFQRSPEVKASRSRREKSGPVFCVGRKAFIHWPALMRKPDGVPLTDGNGAHLPNDLVDGQQIEIVSWRPHSSRGLLYQIRRVADGREGWILANHLRRQAAAESPEGSAGGTR